MLTVCQLVSSGGFYGVESMMISLGRALREQGCRSIVAVLLDRRNPHQEVADEARRLGLDVRVTPCAGRCDRKAIAGLRRTLHECGVHVLHSHGYKADCYAFAAAWPRRVALFATSHNWPDRRLSMRGYASLDRLLLRSFDGVAVVSRTVEGALCASGVRPDRIALVRNGVDCGAMAKAEPTLRIERGWEHDRIIGFIGRHVREKGGDILLRAAAPLVRSRPNVRIVFAGDGPERHAWQRLATGLGIGPHVHFLGARRDLPQLYASLDFVVLPSLNEAMPMCLIEAAAAGKPVIGASVGSVPNLVSPGLTGLLVPPADVQALRAALVRLLDAPEYAARLGTNAASHAAAHFSDKAMAGHYLALYNKAIAVFDRRSRGSDSRAPLPRLWKTPASRS